MIFFLFVFVLGSIAIEVTMHNAVKKHTYAVLLVPLLPWRTQVSFFTIVLNKWWAKLVMQVLVKYEAPALKWLFLSNSG